MVKSDVNKFYTITKITYHLYNFYQLEVIELEQLLRQIERDFYKFIELRLYH